MSMNVNQVQNEFYAREPGSFEDRSLDELLSAASGRSADDQVRIQPVDDKVSTLPISEEKSQLYELQNAILRGDVNSMEDIFDLVNKIGRDGIPYFNTTYDQMMAVAKVQLMIRDKSPSHPVDSILGTAFHCLMSMKEFNDELLDSIINPNSWNGGKHPADVEA